MRALYRRAPTLCVLLVRGRVRRIDMWRIEPPPGAAPGTARTGFIDTSVFLDGDVIVRVGPPGMVGLSAERAGAHFARVAAAHRRLAAEVDRLLGPGLPGLGREVLACLSLVGAHETLREQAVADPLWLAAGMTAGLFGVLAPLVLRVTLRMALRRALKRWGGSSGTS